MDDLKQPLAPAPPTYSELWDHVVNNILILNEEDVKNLSKLGLSSMSNIFRYMTNLNGFNTRFKDDTPTIMNLRYFIMHCYVNDYNVDTSPLIQHTVEMFNTIDIMGLKMDYDIKLTEAEQKKTYEKSFQQTYTQIRPTSITTATNHAQPNRIYSTTT